MLYCKINGNNGEIELSVGGKLYEIMADITTMLGIIYDKLEDDLKDQFEFCLYKMFEEKIYKQSIAELEERAKKIREDNVKEKESLSELEGLINQIKGILK